MKYKFLEKKVELGPVERIDGKESNLELTYYLLENDSPASDESLNNNYFNEKYPEYKIYGIEIVKKDELADIENVRIENLYCCRESAKKILESLARNTVTPVSLSFVLDDMIGL
jgi:hypothetical protein